MPAYFIDSYDIMLRGILEIKELKDLILDIAIDTFLDEYNGENSYSWKEIETLDNDALFDIPELANIIWREIESNFLVIPYKDFLF